MKDLLDKKCHIILQNHYDATNGQVKKKEIGVIKGYKMVTVDDYYPHVLCTDNNLEYKKFMEWFEKEVLYVLNVLWNQHFIIKLTLSQLNYRETIIFLENLREFSSRITLELVEEVFEAPTKNHFSTQEKEAFFKGKLKMLKKWKYTISKHIEGGSMERILALTPCIDEIKYAMNKEASLREKVTDFNLFIQFWEYWAKTKQLGFVVAVEEKTDFMTKLLIQKKIQVQYKRV